MFESQGTTPEPARAPMTAELAESIEVARQALMPDYVADLEAKIARLESDLAWANSRVESVEDIVSAITPDAMLQADITILEAKATELEGDLEVVGLKRDHFQRLYNESQAKLNSASQAIQDVLAGDVDAQQTFEDFRTAFELLGVTLDREVEIEISVTWRGTITLPANVEVSELDIDDFGIDIGNHAEYETNGFGYGMHDYGINEI